MELVVAHDFYIGLLIVIRARMRGYRTIKLADTTQFT